MGLLRGGGGCYVFCSCNRRCLLGCKLIYLAKRLARGQAPGGCSQGRGHARRHSGSGVVAAVGTGDDCLLLLRADPGISDAGCFQRRYERCGRPVARVGVVQHGIQHLAASLRGAVGVALGHLSVCCGNSLGDLGVVLSR